VWAIKVMAAIAVLGATLLAPPATLADAHEDYVLNCQGCHGADGGGASDAVPSFRGSLGRFLRVPGGREYLVRVPGTSQSALDDARIASLLNWMLHAFSADDLPRDFTPYDEAEIARVRRPPLIDVTGVRRRLVDQIRALGACASSDYTSDTLARGAR